MLLVAIFLILPVPLNHDGFIDEKKIFQICIGTLKLPLEYLNEISPVQFGWLYENHIEEQMNHYESISTAFAFGYASAKKGKKIHMFKKNDKDKIGRISKEQKEKERKYIISTFEIEGQST